jgi:hypothetical protein
MPELVQGPLADFHNPPVVETVLSAQFDRLSAMRMVHLGLFWNKMKSRFPQTEERSPLIPSVEHFSDSMVSGGRPYGQAITDRCM